jgi:hypothetical protein
MTAIFQVVDTNFESLLTANVTNTSGAAQIRPGAWESL